MKNTSRVVIIIPTYNEAANIEPLLDAIRAQETLIPYDVHVLIVDDGSPDGTADLVRQRQSDDAKLHLLCGTKQGLGAAYIRGIRHALTELQADIVMEMDADFSHAPQDIPRLLAPLAQKADFAIGSRYVPGGSIPANWGALRKLNSYCGNLVARYVGGLSGVRDCTAGFRAIKADLLRRVDLESLDVKGYVFQVALLKKCLEQGAGVAEVPVHFIDRERGTTKLGLRDIFEFVFYIWALRLQSFRMFSRFCAVGASGVLVNLLSFQGLLYCDVTEILASPLAVEVSICSNFFLNNRYAFASLESSRSFFGKLLRFNAASLLGLCAQWGAFLLLSQLLPQWPPVFRQGVAIIPGICINYLLYSRWVFGNFRLRNALARFRERT